MGSESTVAEIRLLVSQSPAGATTHRILAKGPGTKNRYTPLVTLKGETADSQLLSFKPPEPLKGIRYVKIETTASPSWIAWREIEVIAGE
ncbi:MAG: hypothetical protein ACM3X6_11235 [Patescibacteria group bacterium]